MASLKGTKPAEKSKPDSPTRMASLKGTKPGEKSKPDAPTGIRTPVLALKGLRPSPLDDGGKCAVFITRFMGSGNEQKKT